MKYKRDLKSIITGYKKFPAIALLGPRQSGKTTLAQEMFKNYRYTSFEDLATRELAQADPRKFLTLNENKYGIIIDEFQHVPHILSYIQLEADEKDRPGYFVLVASQDYLKNDAITQSLAGRVGILTLLPLSIRELTANKLLVNQSVDTVMVSGGYPQLYAKKLAPHQFYPSYIQSYVELDVRQLAHVDDVHLFQRFMHVCAERIGQQFDLSELASSSGVTVSIAQQWLSILEANYIVFLLQPYFKKLNRKNTKSPKLYFYDTGLACSLLGIETPEQLAVHPLRGSMFESFIIADLSKQSFNAGIRSPLYYWRDLDGSLEIQCVLEQGSSIIAIAINSGATFALDSFDNLQAWNTLAGTETKHNYFIYGGNYVQSRPAGNIRGWQTIGDLVKKLRDESTFSARAAE